MEITLVNDDNAIFQVGKMYYNCLIWTGKFFSLLIHLCMYMVPDVIT